MSTPTANEVPATDEPAVSTEDPNCASNLKRTLEFSSENFKVEISNLPSRTKFHVVKQLLNRHFKIEPHKIRVGDGKAYIAFTSIEERDKAIEKINNQDWKGRILSAKPACARYDPFNKKLCKEYENASANEKDGDEKANDEAEACNNVSVNDQVCPLWRKPYAEQLALKEASMRSILNMSKQVSKLSPNLSKDAPSLHEWVQKNKKISCQFDGVEPSPRLTGYRNKCEFNVGRDGTIGFRMGRYKDGSERVVRPPRDCPIVNEIMFKVLEILQELLDDGESTILTGFNHITHLGNLRQITIRTNEAQRCLVIIDLHPQTLDEADINRETGLLVERLRQLDEVISIYVNVSEKNHLTSLDQTLKLVYGQKCLDERLEVIAGSPLNFSIGPASFFQVNTKAAELLYRSIIELADLNPKSLVLDIGCGTGTIGLSLARQVGYVIGIEIVESAVADAKINARENQIENVAFFAGKAEDLIHESIKILKRKLDEQNKDGDIVAIVDPPRIGFNNSFVKLLRASTVKRLIYVACDPKANTNLISLCRPRSKAYQGDPFVPVRAKAFDLFPHTKFCELLLVYERLQTTGSN